MKKVFFIFSSVFLSFSCTGSMTEREEYKLDVLESRGSGLICSYSFGRDVFIRKEDLIVLRRVGGEVRYYVVLPKGEVVPLNSCAVVEKVPVGE